MTAFWALAVARDDLSRTVLFEGAVPEIGSGEVLLRVDRVGVTANNVTYAVLGESFHYWSFFPTEPGWGLVPRPAGPARGAEPAYQGCSRCSSLAPASAGTRAWFDHDESRIGSK